MKKIKISKYQIILTGIVFDSISILLLYLYSGSYEIALVLLALSVHFLISLLHFLYLLINKTHENKGHSVIYFCISTFFYPLGYLSVFIMDVYIKYFLKNQQVFETYKEYVENKNIKIESLEIAKTNIIEEPNSIQPVIDIIDSDNVLMRRAGAKKLGDIKKKESVQILKELLNDKDKEVRFYASSSLIKIESDINKRIKNLQKNILESPNDFNLYKELGLEYFDYTDIGLLDKNTADYYLKMSLERFLTAEKIQDDLSIKMFIARINVKLNRIEKAIEIFNRMIEINPEDLKSYFWRAECYFRQKKFNKVFSDINKLTKFEKLPNLIKTVIPIWQ